MKTYLRFFAFWALTFASCSGSSSPAYKYENVSDESVTGDVAALEPTAEIGFEANTQTQNTVRFTPPVLDENASDEQTRENENLDPAGEPPATQKLIRTGSVEIESNTLTESKNYIDRQLKSAGGYYEDEGFENSSNRTAYNLKARIPAGAFDAFLKALDGAGGTLRNRTIQVSNVTAQYVDVESRLATKRTYMARYKELVQKAGKVADLLAIEENIRILQEEIESTESQLRVLKDQVGYSTLDIELYTYKTVAVTGDSFGTQLGNAFKRSGENGKNFLLWIVENWVVLVLLLAGGVWLRRRWVRRRRKL